jgi:predicted TIM-barrel fold metal-dependent hydrolase
VKDEEGGDAWEFVPGGPLMYIGLVATPGMRFEDIKWKGYTYDTVRRGCWEGKARLEDMDFDGVDAEFIYPSQRTMYYFMGNADRDFHRAGVRAYNDYMAQEFCAADPERLFFLAQMPNLGIQEGIAELERCKEMGARGCIITAWPRAATTSRRPTTSSSAQRPISACRCRSTSGSSASATRADDRGPGRDREHGAVGDALFPPIMFELIMGGLFDRIPKLQIVGVETEIGWIPEALEQVDNFYWRNRAHTGLTIRHLPSHYFRNNFTCTFIQDRTGSAIATRSGSATSRGRPTTRTTAATGPTAARSSRRRCSTCRQTSGTGSARATWWSCTACRRASRAALARADGPSSLGAMRLQLGRSRCSRVVGARVRALGGAARAAAYARHPGAGVPPVGGGRGDARLGRARRALARDEPDRVVLPVWRGRARARRGLCVVRCRRRRCVSRFAGGRGGDRSRGGCARAGGRADEAATAR